MEKQDTNAVLPVLAGAAMGVIAHGLWNDHQEEQARKSRAEHDDPDMVAEILAELESTFEWVSLPEGLISENEYRDTLAEKLDQHSSFEIEVEPNYRGMKPDILVGGLVAIELKLNPSKVEIDRMVGQLVGYAREWVTAICLIDTPASKVRMLEELLADSGLDHLDIIEY